MQSLLMVELIQSKLVLCTQSHVILHIVMFGTDVIDTIGVEFRRTSIVPRAAGLEFKQLSCKAFREIVSRRYLHPDDIPLTCTQLHSGNTIQPRSILKNISPTSQLIVRYDAPRNTLHAAIIFDLNGCIRKQSLLKAVDKIRVNR